MEAEVAGLSFNYIILLHILGSTCTGVRRYDIMQRQEAQIATATPGTQVEACRCSLRFLDIHPHVKLQGMSFMSTRVT